MFGVVERDRRARGGKGAARHHLVRQGGDRPLPRLRGRCWRARKADGIVPALEAFPASASYKKVDVDDLLVKLIEKIGQPARPALVQALGSRVAAGAHDGGDGARADRPRARRAGACRSWPRTARR